MQTVTSILEELSRLNGVEGCALVEADTGMVWHYAGARADIERVGEAAIEFWRTQRRVAIQLQSMGEMKFANFKYANKTIALIPCDEERGLVLVCLAASTGVDWQAWVNRLPLLRKAVNDYIARGNLIS